MQEHNPFFPLFMDLSHKKILIFGGGTIALRRIRTLLNFSPDISVIAPEASEEIILLAQEKKLLFTKRCYKKGDCLNTFLVIAATDSRKVNHAIYEECSSMPVFLNVADCKEECNFYFPAIIEKDSLVIGVTASGTNHKAAKKTAEAIRTHQENLFCKQS